MKTNLKIPAFLCLAALASCTKKDLQTDQTTALNPVSLNVKAKSYSAMATTIYYVDNVSGNDSNNGTSTSSAWKTISKVNATTFAPGNEILFKAGGSWTNELHPLGSGTGTNPIIIGRYGSGNAPLIQGGGTNTTAIYLYNQQYWEINDLEVTNFNSSEEGGISLASWEANDSTTYAYASLPDQVDNSNSMKTGILIQAQDAGALNHIYLHHLNVHGVNGAMDQEEATKYNGGIEYDVSGTSTPTYFNDILIDSCNVHDVDKTGLFFVSKWSDRSETSNGSWKPSTNVIIRGCTFAKSGANAVAIRVTDHALIEHNIFDHCAIKGTGNAGYNFNTDYTKWQYNECRYTKANQNDNDAGGLDADYDTKNTIIQYNYLHNNDYGLLITGGPGNFNDGTIVKYNIIEKDGVYAHPNSQGKFVLKISGAATNTSFYNNTIDIGPSQTDTKVVYDWTWSGSSPSATSYLNNIIDNNGSSSSYDFGSSTGNSFDYNAFYKNAASNQPSQSHNITGDVKFVNPGAGDPNGYKLLSGSVAYLSGVLVSGNGAKDYFGNSVSQTSAPSVGAYNGPLQ